MINMRPYGDTEFITLKPGGRVDKAVLLVFSESPCSSPVQSGLCISVGNEGRESFTLPAVQLLRLVHAFLLFPSIRVSQADVTVILKADSCLFCESAPAWLQK